MNPSKDDPPLNEYVLIMDQSHKMMDEEEEADQIDGHISDETCFFEEFDQVFHQLLPNILDDTCCSGLAGIQALNCFRSIIDKYLEFPTLLDPYLEGMAGSMCHRARNIVHELYQQDSTTQFPDKVLIQSLKRLLSAIYVLAKVRGRKQVQRYLSHEACDVEPVLYVLRCFETDLRYQDLDSDSISASPTWESIFSLFLWLGILSLVPFGLNSIDSTFRVMEKRGLVSSNSNLHESFSPVDSPTLVTSILRTAREHLSDAGPTRETAAACLASLLSRPDLEEVELQDFFTFSSLVMERYWKSLTDDARHIEEPNKEEEEVHNGNSIFLVMGVIHTIAIIFKTGSRSTLMDRHLRCVERIWQQAILLAEWASPKGKFGKGGALLLRKLLVKLFARVGCAYLPPRLAPWRYQRGKRSLLDNVTNAGNHNQANAGASGNHEVENSNIQEDIYFVPDPVEDSMAQMIQSLNDPATAVRWSAAKGTGRLSERLPMVCVDDVIDAILVLCEDKEKDDAWHGSCLALAELARRGLLLPHRLAEVVPKVIFAMKYDIRRGQRNIGSHIRDAACYTCWAFARAYASTVLRPYVPELSKIIVLTSLFDREINCRRAASACFQESVGRQGSDNFKHGIEILTIADYFSLGNRVEAFTSVSIKIAQFEEYRFGIIEHLCENKLFHWDVEIRLLSSKALHSLTPLDRTYFQDSILSKLIPMCTDPNNVCIRHGAVLGVAEIILALGMGLPSHLSESIAEIVPNVEKARLYRGRGGDLMRSSISRLIECLSLSHINLSIKQQVRLLDSIDANLAHPSEDVQKSSASALHALMRSYFPVSLSGPSERLQARVVTKYTDIIRKEDNAAATRGFSLAIGKLPSKLLAPNVSVLDSVIDALCYAAHPKTRVGDDKDAETRRNAIRSLSSLCQTVTIGSASGQAEYPSVGLNFQQLLKIFDAFLQAMQDYNTDRRGDVGSWVRIAAMYGATSLIILTTSSSMSLLPSSSSISSLNGFMSETGNGVYINESICTAVVGAILKQLSEKLDSVRFHAGSCLQKLLLSSDPQISLIPNREVLIRALSLGDPSSFQPINWGQSSITFPLLLKAISIEPYFFPIFSGLVISVGGLTESVTKSATSSILEYCRQLRCYNDTHQLNLIGNALLKLFQENHGDGRIILPLLVTIDKLLSHGCLDNLILDPTNQFSPILFDHVALEASSSTDVKRLMTMVPVVIGLLPSTYCNVVTTKIHPFLMKFLAHRYPRVRRHTAEQLYIKLVEDDGDNIFPHASNLESAMNLLSEVAWEMESGPNGSFRESRNRVSDLLGINLSTDERNLGSKINSIKAKERQRDEFESYASLINAVDR